MMYAYSGMECDRHNFLSFQAIFSSFAPLLTPKIKIWKKCKKKKTPADIILLHTCTIDQDHMMYGSWDMKCNRQEFLSSWAIFCHFTSPLHSLIAWKKKISKTKKPLEISSFYTSVAKITIICYTVPEIWCMTDVYNYNCYFSFWATFCPFAPLTARKMKISKKWKKHLEISSFYTSVP